MLLSEQLYLFIQHIISVIAHFIVSTWSYFLHSLYTIANYPRILLWEFKSARYIHLKQSELCQRFIAICVIINVALVFSPALTWMSGLLSTLFLGHASYCLLINVDPNTTWTERLSGCTLRLENKLALIVQKITYIWFQNSYLYNAELVQIKLNKNVNSHQQTVISLNNNSLRNSELSLPMELNQIIIDYIFHQPIQQLSVEEIISNSLTQQWNLKECIVQQIIEHTFDMSDKSRVCFQICYGDGLGGSLGGNVAMCKDSNSKRAMKLNVNYGCGKMPQSDGPCLQLDLATDQLFDARQVDYARKVIDCSKLTIPVGN